MSLKKEEETTKSIPTDPIGALIDEARMVDKISSSIKNVIGSTKRESSETKEMFNTFAKALASQIGGKKPSDEELNQAIRQLKDVGGLSVLIPLLIAPGSIITVPIITKIAKKFDVDLFPSSHKEPKEKKH